MVGVCESYEFCTEIFFLGQDPCSKSTLLQFPQLNTCLVCVMSVRSSASSVGHSLFSSVEWAQKAIGKAQVLQETERLTPWLATS